MKFKQFDVDIVPGYGTSVYYEPPTKRTCEFVTSDEYQTQRLLDLKLEMFRFGNWPTPPDPPLGHKLCWTTLKKVFCQKYLLFQCFINYLLFLPPMIQLEKWLKIGFGFGSWKFSSFLPCPFGNCRFNGFFFNIWNMFVPLYGLCYVSLSSFDGARSRTDGSWQFITLERTLGSQRPSGQVRSMT